MWIPEVQTETLCEIENTYKKVKSNQMNWYVLFVDISNNVSLIIVFFFHILKSFHLCKILAHEDTKVGNPWKLGTSLSRSWGFVFMYFAIRTILKRLSLQFSTLYYRPSLKNLQYQTKLVMYIRISHPFESKQFICYSFHNQTGTNCYK